nr:hypothetical protein [Tanacetum cinerariifolium]
MGFLCEYPKSRSDQSVVVLGMADGVVVEGSAGADDAGELFFEFTTFVFIFFNSCVGWCVFILSFVSIERIDFKFTNPLMKSFNRHREDHARHARCIRRRIYSLGDDDLLHHHSIHFKMNNKKRIVNLEYFREMLHICPRIPNKTFDELTFEEEILAFLRNLGHSGEIKKITDVNINKLHQPWRSFAAVINKCLSRKSTGYDSLRLSQARILWDMYHKKNVDFAYLLWEDFVYQVEHKDAKKSNEMYYPRFTNFIINFFMTKDPSIPKRNKFGAILPVELTNKDIRNSAAYKEYYVIASGAAPPKTKASVRKTQSSFDTTMPPPMAASTRLSTSAKGKQPAKSSKAKDLSVLSEDEDDQDEDDDDQDDNDDDQDSDNDSDDFVYPKLSTHAEEAKDKESFDPIVQTPSHMENFDDESNDDESHGMNVGGDEGPDAEDDDEELYGDFAEAVSSITGIVDRYIDHWMNEAVKTSYAVAADLSKLELKKILIEKIESNKSIHQSDEQRNLYKALVDAYECNKIILDTYGDTITLKRRKETESTSAPKEKASKTSVKSNEESKSHQKTASESALAEEPMQTTQDLEEPAHLEFETGKADDQPVAEASQHPEWFQKQTKPSIPDRAWNKTLPATHGSIQPWISDLAKKADSRTSFNELMDTPVDFSAFLMNRLKVDTLTPELLAGPTYELMKGSCKSLVELEFFLEEVYKAKTDQLDWNNLEGQQYPHNLLKPLPLIPNSRGRRVIPFDHFINNDLEYLGGGASSRKYTTSVTKTKATYYGHIKWIEDLVPRTMWSQAPVSYDKYALWGISHWGHKRQQFYGFTVNKESARDVYSKRRIIAVIELQIVKRHNYKHLGWITLRRDDGKLYKFKEGNLKRLRIQDIEDMMFTRSIFIQRRVEDLQLGVESYQKKLNLTKLDTYRFDLKRKEAYTADSNPRGFIYQNKDKQNRLMRIDKLHKFSDGTLNDVRTALDDHLKGI